jgi:sugar lactone lactonase YvrE
LNHDRAKARHPHQRLWTITLAALLFSGLFDARGAAAASGFALWVPNEDSSTLTEFQGTLIAGVHRTNRSADLSGCSTIAFDQSGNLWESNFGSNSIVEFTKAQIRALGRKSAPTATVVISQDTGGALNGPEGIAFDAAGNLWVGSEHGQLILEYTAAQLAASGNPTPNVILNGNTFSFGSPSDLVFDTAGNLWVVDEDIPNGHGGTGEIFEYTSAQVSAIAAGTTKVDPTVGIASSDFVHLEGLAFDASGNIWVADESADTVDQIQASQIGTGLSQNVTPAVVLSPTTMPGRCNQSFNGPYGVAVDQSGNLLVGSAGTSAPCAGSLAKFLANSITASGSPKPRVFISANLRGTNLNAPNYLTFGPYTIP